MSYKTELHCHSAAVSACGKIRPARLAEHYVQAGYTTVVLTDHLSRYTFKCENYPGGPDWNEKVDFFMRGYELLREAAGDRLHVLLGMEVRLDLHAAADYLVYGVDEAFIRSVPDLLGMKFKTFSETVREAGLLLIQAHPFRNEIVVTDPALLDGVEVYNAHPRQFSRNDVAEIWADRFGLIKTSGSDLHREEPSGGGILTDAPVTSNAELLATLRSGNYTLIKEGTPGKDGIL